MELSSTVSSKGQITIPVEVRRRLGLRTGERVKFVDVNGDMVLRADRRLEDWFKKYEGFLADELPDSIEALVREERIRRGHDDEERPPKVRRRRSG
jgi:AbrB family looped-hinge helix DNA binding protein